MLITNSNFLTQFGFHGGKVGSKPDLGP